MADTELPLCNENKPGPKRHLITWVKEGGGNDFMGCLHCRQPSELIKTPDVKVDTTQKFVGL